MKREDISKALGGIDDKYIGEAADGPSVRQRPFLTVVKKWVPTAACIVLVAGMALSSLFGSHDKSDNMTPEATGDNVTTPDSEGTFSEVVAVRVKLIGAEEEKFRAVITGPADSAIFPVGTQVTLDLSEAAPADGEQNPSNLWMELADEKEAEITFDSWTQEGGNVTLHVEQLFILN